LASLVKKSPNDFGYKCNQNNGAILQNRPNVEILPIGDRCYDFYNIFPKTFGKKFAFLIKTKLNYAKIGSFHWFLKKRQFFSPNISKNREKIAFGLCLNP
jgi:hypothetical protein